MENTGENRSRAGRPRAIRPPAAFRRLTFRLMSAFIIAVAPLNILSFLMLSQIIGVYRAKLVETYAAQLERYVARVDSNVIYLENSTRDYLSAATVSILNFGSAQSGEVELTRLYEDIKRIRLAVDLKALSYVRDNITGEISISSQPYRYTPGEVLLLKAAIASHEPGSAAYGTYAALDAGDAAYLMRSYDFTRYSFGYLLDAGSILLGATEAGAGESAYLAGPDGGPGVSLSVDGIALPGSPEAGKPRNMNAVTAFSPALGYAFTRLVPRDGAVWTVPFTVISMAIMTGVSLLALPLIWRVSSRNVLKPLRAVTGALTEIEKGNLDYRLPGNAGTYQMDQIYGAVNHMAEEIRRLIVDAYEKEIEKLQTDAVNLRLQIKPHMLLNSLNTICSLSRSGMNREIEEFSTYLIKYFRYALRSNEPFVRLRDEAELIGNYLEVQKIRFPGSFESFLEIAPETEDLKIPPLIMESFVENAIKYALIIGSTISITVRTRIKEGSLLIDVIDTGTGMSGETLEKLRQGEIISDRMGEHLGIRNCHRRLKLYYGEAAVLDIRSNPGEGTAVRLELPLVPGDGGDPEAILPERPAIP